ncbi:MAG TPA: beta-ketoacyl-[acyl-carrier-protein] synthase family protein [Candidatus Binataceae bacterium]|nr:beta-ketoacyl-[acyl-carrier-protein] synthase family protein [Candidatus Binataceae bacterium]
MKLHLNALGVINPLGRSKHEVARNLFAGSRTGLISRNELLPDRSVRVGVVSGPLPELPARLAPLDCRNNRLALAAIGQIENDIRAIAARVGPHRVAVVMGTSTSGIADGEAALLQRITKGEWPEEFRYSRQEIGNLAGCVAAYLELSGPAYTVATACSSSAKVFASAQRLIAAGLCDAAVVGGADTLCRMTLGGFDSLELLAKDYCNPFSRNRDGINIGEGAAVFLMTTEESAVSLLGVGESSDAYHVSSPHPEGEGAALAMTRALEAAHLRPEQIDYINLHGTATALNDAMEARAINRIFSERTPCSSTKSITGHLLGAAGANEAAFLWLMLDAGFASGCVPPHVWDGEIDPAIPRLNLVPPQFHLGHSTRRAALSNSFAFGGSNASLVLGRGW